MNETDAVRDGNMPPPVRVELGPIWPPLPNTAPDGEGELLRGAEGSEVGLLADRDGALARDAAGFDLRFRHGYVSGGEWKVQPEIAGEAEGFIFRDLEAGPNAIEILVEADWATDDDLQIMAASKDLLAVCVAYREACRLQGIRFGSINGDADAAIAKATARPLPKSERPKSEASEPAPEAAHTDQGAR